MKVKLIGSQLVILDELQALNSSQFVRDDVSLAESEATNESLIMLSAHWDLSLSQHFHATSTLSQILMSFSERRFTTSSLTNTATPSVYGSCSADCKDLCSDSSCMV
ncbi:hypothetical protein PAMP_003446 [Pampus punctatissimus]